MKNWVVMVILYTKVKSVSETIKILNYAVFICEDLLKIGVRESKVANKDDTLLYLTPNFSGIDISCVLSDDRVSLISSDSAIFLLNV